MRSRKDGVAVIVVLGLLALLMVLGVAFTVTMRTERAGVSNYVGAVRDRHLAWAGIARAIDAIDRTVTNMYPDGDFLVSGANVWGQSATGGVLLLTGIVTNHVPDALHTYKTERSDWVELDGETKKIAYIVLNLSDMLDINYAGGMARAGGTDPGEIVLDPVLASASAFINDIVTNRPYSGLPHFRSVHTNSNGQATITPSKFVAYSRYPSIASPTQQEDLSGDLGVLTSPDRSNKIRNGLARVLLDRDPSFQTKPSFRDNVERLRDSLFDYIDPVPNAKPRRLDGPNLKSVPLLNEITLMSPSLVGTPVSNFNARLVIENWLPRWDVPVVPSFEIECNAVFTFTLTSDANGSPTYNMGPVTNAVVLNKTIRIGNFWLASRDPDPDISQSFAGIPVLTNTQTYSLSVVIQDVNVVEATSREPLDSAGDAQFTFTATGTIATNGSAGAVTLQPASWEAIDPRLNWRQSYWASTNKNSPGKINGATSKYMDDNPYLSHAVPTYVSNAGRVFSPLEIGNLPAPDIANNGDFSPWHTLRVFDRADGRQRHRLLEHFTVVNTNDIRRGLVNLNTFYPSVLQTAFDGIPFPGPVSSNSAPVALTAELAKILTDHSYTNGAYRSLTEMLDLDWRRGALANRSDIELNALASYSVGLLGVRQNLFLVIARAGAGTSKVLAVVWRDPVENAEGLHDSFIQYLEWLD